MGGNALRSAELVLPGRVVVSSASECRWSVSSSGARFGRCGYRVGGLKILYLPVCRRLGGQRRTNISFARSGSDALVSAGFSTLASLVCPARNSFLSLFTRNETGDPFPGRLSGQKSARTVGYGLIR